METDMDDIIERLKRGKWDAATGHHRLFDDAIAEIERLRRELRPYKTSAQAAAQPTLNIGRAALNGDKT